MELIPIRSMVLNHCNSNTVNCGTACSGAKLNPFDRTILLWLCRIIRTFIRLNPILTRISLTLHQCKGSAHCTGICYRCLNIKARGQFRNDLCSPVNLEMRIRQRTELFNDLAVFLHICAFPLGKTQAGNQDVAFSIAAGRIISNLMIFIDLIQFAVCFSVCDIRAGDPASIYAVERLGILGYHDGGVRTYTGLYENIYRVRLDPLHNVSHETSGNRIVVTIQQRTAGVCIHQRPSASITECNGRRSGLHLKFIQSKCCVAHLFAGIKLSVFIFVQIFQEVKLNPVIPIIQISGIQVMTVIRSDCSLDLRRSHHDIVVLCKRGIICDGFRRILQFPSCPCQTCRRMKMRIIRCRLDYGKVFTMVQIRETDASVDSCRFSNFFPAAVFLLFIQPQGYTVHLKG